jgi:leucyl/phenylalanyl-tRNA--protein transferase
VTTEPTPSRYRFPTDVVPDEAGIVAVGADLEPGTLLAAYRSGLFPMKVQGHLAWFSPDPRAVIPVDGLRVTRSLRQSARRYRVTVDRAFDAVTAACGNPDRPHGWIDDDFRAAYGDLHRLGWAHSVECWADDQLVGGLYGVSIGRFFAGESMFHAANDASKVALLHLVEHLAPLDGALLDVQWTTDHLASMGAVEIPAQHYRSLLVSACEHPGPEWPTSSPPAADQGQ